MLNLCNQNYQARWKDIELSICRNPPIQAVLGNKDLGKFLNGVQNPWIKSYLKIWNSVREEYKLQDKLIATS